MGRLGIADLGLGIGNWSYPQSPIPNPQSPKYLNLTHNYLNNFLFK